MFPQLLSGQTHTITTQEPDSLLYTIVDKEPEFPGGIQAMMNFISMNTQYPPIQRCEPDGSVMVSFIVETDGKISHVTIAKGFGNPSQYYDKEALRVIGSMPRWSPGQKDGRVVRTRRFLPVKFHIR